MLFIYFLQSADGPPVPASRPHLHSLRPHEAASQHGAPAEAGGLHPASVDRQLHLSAVVLVRLPASRQDEQRRGRY